VIAYERRLTFLLNADILSDMKTFTVRQLDREPALVLDAADHEGIARIKRRDGRTYCVQPEVRRAQVAALPDFESRIKKLFPQAIPRAQAKFFDKLLAGE